MKPSERIKEIYFQWRGNSGDDPTLMVDAVMQYLDEQAEQKTIEEFNFDIGADYIGLFGMKQIEKKLNEIIDRLNKGGV